MNHRGNSLRTDLHFTCDCEHKGFDHIIHTQKVDYYLCSCDKIYKLTTSIENYGRGKETHHEWEFVNYDCCAYCSRPKDICVGPDIDCQLVPLGEKK